MKQIVGEKNSVLTWGDLYGAEYKTVRKWFERSGVNH